MRSIPKTYSKRPKTAPGRTKHSMCYVWIVVGKDGPVEASLDKRNLPDCGKGETVIRKMIEL